jgi:hypothetical protein
MGDSFYEFPLDELLAGLIELVREGNPEALASLIALVREQAAQLPDDGLIRLARLEARGVEPLREAVRREMQRRGIWRAFRIREVARVYGTGARWTIGIVLLAALFLAVVFGLLIGIKWGLYWLGF